MSLRRRPYADYNYWPSVADMILAAFMVMLILWFTENLRAFSLVADAQRARGEKAPVQAENLELRTALDQLRGEQERLRLELSEVRTLRPAAAEMQRLKSEAARLEAALRRAQDDAKAATRGDNDQPPNIVLGESSQYKFPTGSATLSPRFAELLATRIFPRLKEIVERYPQVDLIEIIGHTDGQPLSGQASNLDRVLQGAVSVGALRAGSNADLGLMRAVAVRLALERAAEAGGLPPRVRFRTYSAAQTAPETEAAGAPPTAIPVSGDEVISPGRPLPAASTRGGADEARRRIEIRFTRLNPNAPR